MKDMKAVVLYREETQMMAMVVAITHNRSKETIYAFAKHIPRNFEIR